MLPTDAPAPQPSGVVTARQWLRVACTGMAFVVFFGGALVLGGWFLPLVHLWPGPRVVRQKRCQRVVRMTWLGFHAYLRWVGLVNLDVGPQRMVVSSPAIIIANHPTLFDITAMIVAVGPACIVAKRALFSNPFVGLLLRACGHIRVGAPGGAPLPTVDEAEDRLRAGHSIVLFPEGTRSPVGGLGRFHVGAFELARRTGVPVVPVRITARPPALWKGQPWYRIPTETVQLRLEPLAPFSVAAGLSSGELRELTLAVRARLDPG
jgi:1-acyl-sn-glycerol-3-phosphate acyltransferase